MKDQHPAEAPVAWQDEAMALHWIDRYASGVDDEPQMDRILDCVHFKGGALLSLAEKWEAHYARLAQFGPSNESLARGFKECASELRAALEGSNV